MRRKLKPADFVFDIFNTIELFIVAIITLCPFIHVLWYSVSDPTKLVGGLMLYPRGLSFAAYNECFRNANIIMGLTVSALRSIFGPLLTLLVCSLTAYVLMHEKLVGKKFFNRFFIITMYVSGGIIPMYVLTVKLGLSQTFLVYLLPYAVNVFQMILIKTFIQELPYELQEAAVVDGANDFIIYARIVLPVCVPVCAAVFLFQCVMQWNMFQDTMFYNSDVPSLHTIQYVLVSFLKRRASDVDSIQSMAQGGTMSLIPMTSIRMAMTIIVIIPISLVYPTLQRYFMKGLLIGAVKG